MTEEIKEEKIRTDAGNDRKMTRIFERYLTIWVGLCIIGGIFIGKICVTYTDLSTFVVG